MDEQPQVTRTDRSRPYPPHGVVLVLQSDGYCTNRSLRSATMPTLFLCCAVHSAVALAHGATFNVRDYGAVGDGKADDTAAVRKAAGALASVGGGKLLFPSSFSFITGSFNLTSNAELAVEGTILGSHDGTQWPLVDAGAVWPQFGHGSDCTPGTEQCRLMHQALIFAWRATNITLSGHGTVDARGQPWWDCARDLSKPPCSGHGRPHLLMLSNVTGVKVADLHFQNSPDWTLHFSSVKTLRMARVYVTNPKRDAPNSDGIDLDCVQASAASPQLATITAFRVHRPAALALC